MRYILLALENLSPPTYGIIDTAASPLGDNRYHLFGVEHSLHYGAREIYLIEDKSLAIEKLDQLNAEEETK